MKTTHALILGGLMMVSGGLFLYTFAVSVETATKTQVKENSKSFAIDSVDYHGPGKDNTLQVSPYWKCHLKGTNVWVRVTENREVGDSLALII